MAFDETGVGPGPAGQSKVSFLPEEPTERSNPALDEYHRLVRAALLWNVNMYEETKF